MPRRCKTLRRNFLQKAGLIATASTVPILGYKAFVRQAEALVPGPDQLAALKRAIAGSLLLPGSAEFKARATDYNRRIDVTPAVIALCSNPEDVAACVRWARTNQIPIRLRSGGHSYEGFSLGPGIIIDVSSMNQVQVNPTARTALVQAGARLGKVYKELWQHGFTLPAGLCPTVGIAGLTLGGGFGLLSRKWGLTADSLLSLEMVDASSRLVTTDSNQHSDLFWACRGAGGGHFGVVTSLKFRIYPIRNVALYEVDWPITEAKQVIQAWQDWAPHVADELTCELVIGAGSAACKSAGQFLGTEEDLHQLLQPLTRVGAPRIKVWTSTFIQALEYFAGPDDPKPIYLKAKSDYAVQKLSPTAIDTLLSHLGQLHGAASGWIQFDNYGGAINRVPRDATAFVHRAGTLYSLQYNAIWSQATEAAAPMKWIRDFYAAMRPYFSGYSYVNYCDLDLPDWQNAYYGSNFQRLTRVKAIYDPQNVFKFPQSIPPLVRIGH